LRVLTKNKNPKVSRKEFKEAAKFIYACLVSRRMFLDTTIIIESKDGLLSASGERLDGQTHVLKHKYQKYRIEINSSMSRKKQLQTLAHELVHVKQFAYDELGHTETRRGQTFTKWKSRMVNETRCRYAEWPWEVEAFRREGVLYERYIDHASLLIQIP
jgi:hypothetical protein